MCRRCPSKEEQRQYMIDALTSLASLINREGVGVEQITISNLQFSLLTDDDDTQMYVLKVPEYSFSLNITRGK